MSRIPLVTSREGLDEEGRAVFDRIAESRGTVQRPFQVLLHAPDLADRVAALGHAVRFGSGLADADRELATLATGRARGCAFVWDSHVDAAREAGVDPDALPAASGRDAALVAFVDEVCAIGRVTDETFRSVHELLGREATVELALVAGYYSMLATVMGAFDAC
jgi:4-carboxymuconolactone decarboxylase